MLLVRTQPLVLRAALTAALVVGAPMIASAQEPPGPPDPSGPPAAAPVTPPAPRPVSAAESIAIAREYAIRDSILRQRREQVDSLRRARREAARAGKPRRSPAFGEPPFFGYTWVFYADIVTGAIIGLILFLGRRRATYAPVSDWWAVAAMIAGGVAGACVFIPFFFLAIFASVISFFGELTSPITLFSWTLAVMMLTVLLVKLARRHGGRRHLW